MDPDLLPKIIFYTNHLGKSTVAQLYTLAFLSLPNSCQLALHQVKKKDTDGRQIGGLDVDWVSLNYSGHY